MEKVIKRNGKIVDYEGLKIENAVYGAFKEVHPNSEEQDSTLIEMAVKVMVEVKFSDVDAVSVEDIQDAVEESLMLLDKEVAKAYIKYRYKRQALRSVNDDFMLTLKNKLAALNVVNQNANVDEKSFGGRMGETGDIVAKKIALEYYVSPVARKNHEDNIVYIHDLAHYALGDHNCLTAPLDKLLMYGFNTRQTDVRGAKTVNTAGQLTAVIFQLQSLCQFGGVSASHYDWTLVPFVRMSFSKHFKNGLRYITECDLELINRIPDQLEFDNKEAKAYDKVYKYALDMTTKEVYQAIEALYHNLNTLQSRSGNQLPFTSINYGTCTLPEGRLITKALLDTSLKGTGKLGKTSIFPCGIFQVMEGINKRKGDPNYDLFRLALKSTATRLYPNYANVDWSGNEGYDRNDPRTYFATMGK